jgi:tRNA(Ile)-lysidine synthase
MTADPLDIVDASLARHAVRGKRVAVALSGGVDSMLLLDLVHGLRTAWSLELTAIHVHHGLSPNADAWADFCGAQCAARQIALSTVRVQVDRQSSAGLEAAARESRYAAFAALPVDYVLLAQHQDDQAETVLHQLLRGTGPAGLAGMGETRVLTPQIQLLRPLLAMTRRAIETWAARRGIAWIHDESNDDTRYMRNFIRHELMPIIAKRFPHYRDSLTRAARHAAESVELTEALAVIDLQWNDGVAYADALDRLPLSRQVNALYHWLRWQEVALPSRDQLEEWARQLFREAPAGKSHQAGGHAYLIRRRKNLLVIEARGHNHAVGYEP